MSSSADELDSNPMLKIYHRYQCDKRSPSQAYFYIVMEYMRELIESRPDHIAYIKPSYGISGENMHFHLKAVPTNAGFFRYERITKKPSSDPKMHVFNCVTIEHFPPTEDFVIDIKNPPSTDSLVNLGNLIRQKVDAIYVALDIIKKEKEEDDKEKQ